MQISAASSERRRPRVTRREAAKVLGCSYDNVRRLERAKQLQTGRPDRNGTVTLDRGEVEELARKRGLQVKPAGELVARVFRLFEAKRTFQQVCIETEQEPDVIQALWERYQAGYDYGKKVRAETEEARREREHEEEMRAMDRELERRRRGVLFAEGEPQPRNHSGPGVASTRAASPDPDEAVGIGRRRR